MEIDVRRGKGTFCANGRSLMRHFSGAVCLLFGFSGVLGYLLVCHWGVTAFRTVKIYFFPDGP